MAETMIRFSQESSITYFGFTGGDPFLYYDDIVAALETARGAGVKQPFNIITSGYWAKPDDLTDRLATLNGLGLQKLYLSYDTEHARWVTPEQIMEICRTARDFGIPVEIQSTFWDEAEDIRDLLPDIEGLAALSKFVVARGGRARRSGRRAKHNLPEDMKYSCGRPAHYTLAVYPNGDVYPCCAGDFNKAAKLSCGNIHRNTPGEILDEAYGNFHVRIVKELGWGVFYSVIRRDFPELAAELTAFEDVDTPCEICRDLRTRIGPRLAPVYEKIETEYACAMAEAEWDERERTGAKSETSPWGGFAVGRDELRDLFTRDAEARRRYISAGRCGGREPKAIPAAVPAGSAHGGAGA